MKKVFALLVLLFHIAIWATAQNSYLEKANKLYQEAAYPEAAKWYAKVLESSDVPEAKIKIADCYRLMRDNKQAEYWYEQVMKTNEKQPIHSYYYGLALKANGKYDKAKEVFGRYYLANPNLKRANQVEACENISYYVTDPGIYDIKNLSINTPSADFGAMFYKDGIVFASENNGTGSQKYTRRNAPFLDLFYSSLNKKDDPSTVSPAEKLKGEVNTKHHESTVSFTSDGKTMYFTTNYAKGSKGVNRLRIMTSSLTGDKWSKPQPLPFNNSAYSVGHPAITPDGKRLFFVSDMPGGFGGTDIFVVNKTGSGWSTPENLGPVINTMGNEMFPFMVQDGTLYFSSDDLPGMGGLDIFSARQSNGIWQEPENLRSPINSHGDDFGFIINAQNKGYFSSNRPGGKGGDDIFCFVRSGETTKPTPQEPLSVQGVVYDKGTGKPLAGATVTLINNRIGKSEVQTTDASGRYSMPVEQGDYTLYVAKKDYFTETRNFSTQGKSGVIEENVNLDVALSKIEQVTITSGAANSRPDLPLPTINHIYYDLDQSLIRSDAQVELDKIVDFMKKNPDIKIQLISHTDSRGKADYNQTLSEKRARAAEDYIVSKGVADSRIVAIGKGESQIMNECKDGVTCSEEKHQQNRRTEFIVTGF